MGRLCVLTVRRSENGVAYGALVDLPDTGEAAVLVMVNRLAGGVVQLTVLNFSEATVTPTVRSDALAPGGTVVDLTTRHRVAIVDGERAFSLTLGPFDGMALIVKERPAAP